MASTPSLRAVDICIPLMSGAEGLQATLRSLKPSWASLASRKPRLLIVQDGLPGAGLDDMLKSMPRTVPVRLFESAKPMGFARATNLALAQSAQDGRDVLLLRPGTTMAADTLSSLLTAADQAPMVGLACPRSNIGTLGGLPWDDASRLDSDQAQQQWRAIGPKLPAWQPTPGVDGPCLLIRHGVLTEHGGWTELFGLSQGFELDLALRAARTGWLSAVSNHTFAYAPAPAGETGTDRQATERRAAQSRRLLEVRHPDLTGQLKRHADAPSVHALRLMAGLRPVTGQRMRVAFDLHGLSRMTEAAAARCVATLRGAATAAGDRLQVTALCDMATFRQHGLHEVAGLCREDLAMPSSHGVLVSCTPPGSLAHVRRMNGVAPVVVVALSDWCAPSQVLSSNEVAIAFQALISLANGLVFPSEALARSVALLDPSAGQVPYLVAAGPSRLDEFRLPVLEVSREHILVLNESPLPVEPDLATQALARLLPAHHIVQAAQQNKRVGSVTAVDWKSLSSKSRLALLAQASVVVLPSHGSATPDWLLASLAAAKPVVLRQQAAHAECLSRLSSVKGAYWFGSDAEMLAAVQQALATPSSSADDSAAPSGGDWALGLSKFCEDSAGASEVYNLLLRRLTWWDQADLGEEISHSAAPAGAAPELGAELTSLLDLDNEDFVRQAYRLLLRREADSGGLALYAAARQRGASKAAVLLALSHSSEALMIGARPEGLERWLVNELEDLLQRDGKSFVDSAFLMMLLRPADELGLARYLQLLEQGADKLSLLAELLRSPEGRTRGVKFSGIATMLRRHLRTTPATQVRRLK